MVIDFNKGNGGGGSGYTLPIASEQQLGGIKVGSGLSITTAGTLSADAQPVGVATTASTGIVQVGSGLSITSGGVLSADGVDLTNYVQEQELSGYQTTQAMSGYQTTDAMSGYVETSYLEEEYVPQYAMALKNIQEGNENNYKVVNYGGWLYYVEQYKEDEDGIFVKVRYNSDNIFISMDFDGRTSESSTDILGIDIDDFGFAISYDDQGELFYMNENGEDVYYDPNESVYAYGDVTFTWDSGGNEISFPRYATNFTVVTPYTDNYEILYCVGQEMFLANQDTVGLVKIGGSIDVSKDGQINLKIGNGIGLEVNDSDEGQGVVLGVSAGENVVWGNGVGEAENNAKGLRAPVQSYTQYDLDIVDDYNNSIVVVDNGLGTIDFKNFVLGSDGTYFYITNGDNLERFIRIYVEEGVPYVECSTDGGSESCEIQFQNDGDYKDFRLEIGGTVLQVFESYDNYENIIAEIENAEFVGEYNHIQLFDKDYNMESGAIGTIIFNNTDFIKPYYNYDGDTVKDVGFVLKKRSYGEGL